MALNTVAFGELVRAARGAVSQDQIDIRGGPPRQRQACIERGDSIDLSAAVLTQLDTAFGWPLQASAALLSDPDRPVSAAGAISAGALGVDAAGNEVAMPPALAVASSLAVLPVVQRWAGPVVIDSLAADADELIAAVCASPDTAASSKVVYRVGVDEPARAEAVAVDPIGILRSFRQALNLLNAVRDAKADARPRRRSELYHQALTLLFVASQAGSTAGSGLTALQDFRVSDTFEFLPSWKSFLQASGLANRYRRPDGEVADLFDGFLTLRDRHVDIELKQSSDGLWAPQLVSSPRTVGANTLGDNAIVVYDADVQPDVAAVVDCAYAEQSSVPLLVVSKAGWRSRVGRLPDRGRLVMVDPAGCGMPASNVADPDVANVNRPDLENAPRLTEFPEGSASSVLLPVTNSPGDSAAATRLWIE